MPWKCIYVRCTNTLDLRVVNGVQYTGVRLAIKEHHDNGAKPMACPQQAVTWNVHK